MIGELSLEAEKAAYRFMLAAARDPLAPAQLTKAVDDCALWLAATAGCADLATGRRLGMQAWAELEAGRTWCRVDLEASTPFILVLADKPAQKRWMVPVVDVVRYLGPRLVYG